MSDILLEIEHSRYLWGGLLIIVIRWMYVEVKVKEQDAFIEGVKEATLKSKDQEEL